MLNRLSIPLLSMMFLANTPVFAKDTNNTNEYKGPLTKIESLYKYSDKEMADIQKNIIADAVEAISYTHKALIVLEQDKSKESVQYIKTAIEKLDAVLKKDPSLGLKPVHVSKEIHKFMADASVIESKIKAAKEHLEKGELQSARMLLSPLVSDVTLTVTSIPLDTYTKTIKNVIPLIEDNKTMEAKNELHTLLSTLIIKEMVTPLPPLFAQALLAEAEMMVENEARTEDENKLLAQILKDVHEQLTISELLGYGSKKDFKSMHELINDLEKKTSDGKGGKGWFDGIKGSWSTLFDGQS